MKKILFVLSFMVVNMMFATPDSHAQIQCGDVLAGGTSISNPRVHHLTRQTYCDETATRGVRMPYNYTILDCHHYSFIKRGGRSGFGILAGGSATRRVSYQQYRNCGASGWAVGLRKQYLDDSLTINQGGAEAYTGNHIGVFSTHTSLDVVLGSSMHANGDKGLYVVNSYLPSCISCFANSNGDSGMIFKNSIQPQLIYGLAHRNRDPDVVFNGSHLSVATHHGLIDRGNYGTILFFNGSHHNTLRCVTADHILDFGTANIQQCP